MTQCEEAVPASFCSSGQSAPISLSKEARPLRAVVFSLPVLPDALAPCGGQNGSSPLQAWLIQRPQEREQPAS